MATMKFCSGCNNLLYPKEDKERKILLNFCRTCGYSGRKTCSLCTYLMREVAENNCVHREEIQRPLSERIQFLKDVVSDITYPRTKAVSCPMCQKKDAVIYEATVSGEEETTRVFACCNSDCGHQWIA